MTEKNTRSGARTLLLSVLMSAPGPLVMGLGMLAGQSSTQLADFVRRSAELLGMIVAWLVYLAAARTGDDPLRRARLEKRSNAFVGAMMCLGGAVMLALALTSPSSAQGNVIPGLSIAVMGVIANTLFWRKYTRLNLREPNAILAVQARLYRAKSLVDICVTAALLSVVIAPASPVSALLDRAGSAIVAGYLALCGLRTIREALGRKK